MAVSARVSSAEVTSVVNQRYVGHYFEAALINTPGVVYTPGTTVDSTFLTFEVTPGTAGYEREVINYSASDVIGYANRNVSLAAKVTTFPHDGTATPIPFTHVALLWGSGNVVSLGAATAEPAAGTDGVYTNIPTFTSGSGRGLLVDVTINNNIFVYTISKPGNGYAPGDVIGVLASDLISAGALDPAETTDCALTVSTVSSGQNAGTIVAVVQPTAPVDLTAGNEASFYWNLQVYGAS